MHNYMHVKGALVAVLIAMLLIACSEQQGEQIAYQEHLTRASSYQTQGQYKAATIEYKNALKKSGDSPEVNLQYAKMLNEIGNHVLARRFLEAAPQQDNNAYLTELASTYISLGKHASAHATLNKLSSPSREKDLLEAKLAIQEGALERANSLYAQMLERDSLDSEALTGKATLAALGGKYDQVLQLVESIPESASSYAKAQLLKAGVEITRDELEPAEATLSNLLSLLRTTDQMLPTRVQTLERLAYVLTRLGRTNEAFIYNKLIAEAFPGAREANEQFRLALEDYQNGKLDEAKAKLQLVVEDFPGHARSRQVLGIISYMQGDTQAAAEYLGDVVDPETSSPLATQVYMATNLRLNEPQRVLESLGPTIETQSSPELLALYGFAAVSAEQYAKGEAALLRAARLAPDNARLQLALASYYRVAPNADADKERAFLQRAFELAPTQGQVLSDIASHYRREGEQQKAKQLLVENARKHADNYEANFIASQFLTTIGSLGESNTLLEQAMRVASSDSDKASVQAAMGRNDLLTNENDQALLRFQEAKRLSPTSVYAYAGILEANSRLLGRDAAIKAVAEEARRERSLAAYQTLIRNALSATDVKSAERFYADALQVLPELDGELDGVKATIDYSNALAYLKAGELDRARDIASRSLVTKPDNNRVIAVLAEIEIRSGNLDEARKILDQLTERGLDLGHIVPTLKGDLALANREYAAARTEYERAWSRSKAPVVAEKLHRVMSLQNDQTARSAFLADWQAAQPDNPTAMLFAGMDSQEKGDYDKAQMAYETLLSTQPDSVAALNNLAWIYFEQGNEEALSLLSRAIELAPDNPAVLDSYGWILHKFGRTDEGLPYMKQAVELAPDNKEIKSHYEEAKAAS